VPAPADGSAEHPALEIADVRPGAHFSLTETDASIAPMGAVVVTGAAGGLGSALLAALDARGDAVVALDRAEVAAPAARSYVLDLLDADAVAEAVADAAAAGLTPSHVVSIAGGALMAEKTCTDPAALPLDVFRASVDQNLTSAWITIQACLPRLRAGEGDRSITLTTSTDALASYGLPAYAAAKAGLIGLVRSLSGPLGADGIRVNAVAPGDVPTPRNVREWAHVPGWYDRMRDASVLGRLATPEDIADAYVALIGLRHVTGQTVIVDGGQTVPRPGAGA
jgi:NAD(P)-dependent dehydrogenase (short-subunit alcohol dehydrogenase family)